MQNTMARSLAVLALLVAGSTAHADCTDSDANTQLEKCTADIAQARGYYSGPVDVKFGRGSGDAVARWTADGC